ncbi:hypothetical protein [uncultured Deinococcus sp.]|uniref:hypothetical protein n=1 Tax=uncultured Deinococcus sp. TaxID=158789 RepID=UPI002589F509|nr:hypothetical protein [uncultured Deinococcus sp.]
MSGGRGAEPGAELPPGVAAYLGRATALLWPERRRAVRAELYTHLYHEHLDARLRGLDEAAAWAEALRAAGPVWGVALRLAQVHMGGLTVRTLLLGAALGGAAYAVRPHLTHVPLPVPAQTQPVRP